MQSFVIKISIFFLLLSSIDSYAQEEEIRYSPGKRKFNAGVVPQVGQTQNNGQQSDNTGADSMGFKRRDDSKDRVLVTYRYLDSSTRHSLDSSVNNFDTYFSIPSNYQYLGNNGSAAFPLVFTPVSKSGFDAGFHAFDIYKFSLADTRLYRTNMPFSMISYQLASGKEQMIDGLYTQNPKPNINIGFEYRLINAPGFFVAQNTNHNNFRLSANYTGTKKRYRAGAIFLSNNIRASENGGIINDSELSDPNKKKRFSVPVNLGGDLYQSNPFSTVVKTGNSYKDMTFFFRHSLDFGKRDSVEVNDSTTEYIYYPKFRLQHSFTYNSYQYKFRDEFADSSIYSSWYGATLDRPSDTFELLENWKIIENDFSILQFPDSKNTAQFIAAGVRLQNIVSDGKPGFNNLSLHGEYRHPTHNKLWDMQLSGEFYLSGLNSGDYSAHAAVSRYLSKRLGNISLFFTNINRTPSFIFDNRSAFNLGNNNSFRKENITSFGASSNSKFISFGFRDHVLSNYCYFTDYYHTAQYSKLMNIFQVYASKKIRLSRFWNWYLDATFQQTDVTAPVQVPLLYTRSRIAYEGVFFRNLNLSTGVEVRYYTPYKASNYSPAMGQFFVQDTITIRNLPDIAAFLHFRIRSFTGFIRLENLNTLDFSNGFSFTNNNFAAPHYPTQGYIFRFGIKWWFAN